MRHCRFEDADVAPGSVGLVVTSPPYGIGKSYEAAQTLEAYEAWAAAAVARLVPLVRPGGAVCWQVGTYVHADGSLHPLDVLYIPLFQRAGLRLRNRLVWRFAHGLHATHRLSGRYEVLLWFVKPGADFVFNLDEVREPATYPGKRAYKGPNRGALSGNSLGKNPGDVWAVMRTEWDAGVMDIPPVKHNHPEKTAHPCQFPVELAERCVLLFSRPGDVIFDPFAGSGATLVAAEFHGRIPLGCEADEAFARLAAERLALARRGELRTRPLGAHVQVESEACASRTYPAEWKPALDTARKRPRLVPSPLQEYAARVLGPD